jgi:hypothetical protein
MKLDKVTVSFQYDKKEYINAFRMYLFKSKIIRKFDLVITGVMSVFEIILLIFNGISVYSIVLGSILGFYIILFALLYFLQPSSVYKRSPKLKQAYTLTFSKDQINFKTSGIASSLNWNTFNKIWNCHDFYYLIQAKSIYTIVPKRAFRNENELKTFEKIVESANIPYTIY